MSREKKELEREIDEKIKLEKTLVKDLSYHHEYHKKGRIPTLSERARPEYFRQGD